MYSSSGLTDLAPRGSYDPSGGVRLSLGCQQFHISMSTIHHHLPGLSRALRRSWRYRPRDVHRQFDVMSVLPSQSKLPPEISTTDVVTSAQAILGHARKSATKFNARVLSHRFNIYLQDRDMPVRDWKDLVKQYVVTGILLDQRVFGCSRELFDAFSDWAIEHAPILVRAMPLAAFLDFIHAWERSRHSASSALESMMSTLDSQTQLDLLYASEKPTYLGQYISSSMVRRLRRIIRNDIANPHHRDWHHRVDRHSHNNYVVSRPTLLGKQYHSTSSVPRVLGASLVSGEAYSSARLHDMVNHERDRIRIVECGGGRRCGTGRIQSRCPRACHATADGYYPSIYDEDDDEFSFSESDSDYDDVDDLGYFPGYDEDVYRPRRPHTHMLSQYADLEDYDDSFGALHHDVVHGIPRTPIMV